MINPDKSERLFHEDHLALLTVLVVATTVFELLQLVIRCRKTAIWGESNEEVLMQGQTLCGGHWASFCPPTITTIPKSAIRPC